MYDIIESLFSDNHYNNLWLYKITHNKEGFTVTREETSLKKNCSSGDGNILVGLEYYCDFVPESLEDILEDDILNVKGICISAKSKKLAMQWACRMKELPFKFRDVEVYGIDPDYYFALVPIIGKNRANIERYIFDLKTDFSFRGKIKRLIKNLLITIGQSHSLYEKFIVVAER